MIKREKSCCDRSCPETPFRRSGKDLAFMQSPVMSNFKPGLFRIPRNLVNSCSPNSHSPCIFATSRSTTRVSRPHYRRRSRMKYRVWLTLYRLLFPTMCQVRHRGRMPQALIVLRRHNPLRNSRQTASCSHRWYLNPQASSLSRLDSCLSRPASCNHNQLALAAQCSPWPLDTKLLRLH